MRTRGSKQLKSFLHTLVGCKETLNATELNFKNFKIMPKYHVLIAIKINRKLGLITYLAYTSAKPVVFLHNEQFSETLLDWLWVKLQPLPLSI